MTITEQEPMLTQPANCKHEKYDRLLQRARALAPLPTAVAYPCDESSLTPALDAARIGLITPLLVGPQTRINDVAKKFDFDLGGTEAVHAPDSHGAAERR